MTKVEIKGKKAEVTYDPALTDEEKIIESFNSEGGRYKASKG